MSCRVSKRVRLKPDGDEIVDTIRVPGTFKRLATERLTRLGDRLRHAIGDRELMPYQVTRADIDVIQLAAEILSMNEYKTTQPTAETQLTPEQINDRAKREAVKVACKDILMEGGLDFLAQTYGVPASDLRRFVNGDDTALSDSQIECFAVDLLE